MSEEVTLRSLATGKKRPKQSYSDVAEGGHSMMRSMLRAKASGSGDVIGVPKPRFNWRSYSMTEIYARIFATGQL